VRVALKLVYRENSRKISWNFSSETHLEDVEYTNIISVFPFQEGEAKNFKNTEVADMNANTPTPKEENSEEISNNKNFFIYKVSDFDTLDGLSLRFGITVRFFWNIIFKWKYIFFILSEKIFYR
jgi:hypothetical protein